MPGLLLLAPLPDFLLQPLRASHNCHSLDGLAGHEEKIRGVVGQGGTDYRRDILERLPHLEIISVFGVGYDGVPLDCCRSRGIRVTNTPDVLTDDVADIAVSLVLMTSRRLVEANRFLHRGQWLAGAFPLASALRGKIAGILGLGRIGKAIANRLSAFGMSIAYHGRWPQADVPFRYCSTVVELARESDFLIVACPGGSETSGLVDAAALQALGREGTLINIARGSIVDEGTLIAALQTGGIKAAGLDVFADEPRAPAALMDLENVVLLPHVGSGTTETRRAMADLVVRNLEAHFAGQPLLTAVL